MTTDTLWLWLTFILIGVFVGSAYTIVHLVNLYGSTLHG